MSVTPLLTIDNNEGRDTVNNLLYLHVLLTLVFCSIFLHQAIHRIDRLTSGILIFARFVP